MSEAVLLLLVVMILFCVYRQRLGNADAACSFYESIWHFGQNWKLL